MADSNFNSIVQSMVKGMDGFLSTKTVVGEPQKIGDTIIVPFVDVSFGMGAGNVSKEKQDGGAGGLSGKMAPSAVLIISNGTTKLVNIKNQDSIGKIIDMVPDIINKVAAKKEIKVSDDTAVNTAFNDGLEEKPIND